MENQFKQLARIDEPARPFWFKAMGFVIVMCLIVLWWVWAVTLADHLLIAGVFVAFLALAKWANTKLGFVKGK